MVSDEDVSVVFDSEAFEDSVVFVDSAGLDSPDSFDSEVSEALDSSDALDSFDSSDVSVVVSLDSAAVVYENVPCRSIWDI